MSGGDDDCEGARMCLQEVRNHRTSHGLAHSSMAIGRGIDMPTMEIYVGIDPSNLFFVVAD
jgi:hypothetical protein